MRVDESLSVSKGNQQDFESSNDQGHSYKGCRGGSHTSSLEPEGAQKPFQHMRKHQYYILYMGVLLQIL